MNSPLLKKLSKRKRGWRPKAIHDDKGLIRNACMVSNGSVSLKVDVPMMDNLNDMDKLLEVQVLKVIKELNERDDAIIKKQTLIFSVLASACVQQAEMFRGLIHQEGKQELNSFINRTNKLTKIIQKDFIQIGGDKMKEMIEELKDVSIRIFMSFGTAIDSGKIEEFVNYVESFDKKQEGKLVKLKDKKPKAKKK